MLLAEQGGRRCESPLPPAVLSSALTFTNRRLRRRASLAAQRGLAERAEFRSTDATGPLPFSDASFDAITCIDAINHFPERPRVIAEWARLLKPGGRLLFTDPISVTGALTNAEIALRSSAGFYLFVPHGYDERVIAHCGLAIAGV